MQRYLYLCKQSVEEHYGICVIEAENKTEAWDKIEEGSGNCESGILVSIENFESLYEQFNQLLKCEYCGKQVANPWLDNMCPKCENLLFEAQIMAQEEAEAEAQIKQNT